MEKKFQAVPYEGVTKELAAVAMGTLAADLVIEDGTLIEVCTGRVLPHIDVAVKYGYIALVGDASGVKRDAGTSIISAEGKYIMPGLIDSHMHVESTMVDLPSFAAGILPHGTTTICPDNHEMTNVLGLKAMQLFFESAKNLPLKVLTALPVCVPSIPGMEDAGAVIGPSEAAEAYDKGWAELQGEQMNFPGVIFGDETVHAITAEGIKKNKILTGHYAGSDLNSGLNSFIASGMTACHETTTAEGALKRAELGMYVQQRYGSAWLDLPNLVAAYLEKPEMDTRFFTLVTDDVTPFTVAHDGHLIRVLRKAVQLGVDPVRAIQMVTINAAQLLEKARWIGSVTPGRAGDILIIDNLTDFKVEKVFSDGRLVAENEKLIVDIDSYDYPEWATNTMHLAPLAASDFKITLPGNDTASDEAVSVRVIGLVPGMVFTKGEIRKVTPSNGILEADPATDLAKIGVFYRHGASLTGNNYSKIEGAEKGDWNPVGSRALGFASGTGFLPGTAYASTVSHDCHNLMVIGNDDQAMMLAANTLIESGGGLAVVHEGRVAAHMPLPLAGLMSLESVATASDQLEAIESALKKAGGIHESFEMTLSLLALIVLGELHISNRGLVELKDGKPPQFVSLFV
ncbi:MAG: adenine deaminase [Spirochaetales bacterium]|nr:adenine deaminase [Spirochaetales bacterium]